MVVEGENCISFVETKHTYAGKSNQLHIEKILGVGDYYRRNAVFLVLLSFGVLLPTCMKPRWRAGIRTPQCFVNTNPLWMIRTKINFTIYLHTLQIASSFLKILITGTYGTDHQRTIHRLMFSVNLCCGMHRRKRPSRI